MRMAPEDAIAAAMTSTEEDAKPLRASQSPASATVISAAVRTNDTARPAKSTKPQPAARTLRRGPKRRGGVAGRRKGAEGDGSSKGAEPREWVGVPWGPGGEGGTPRARS